jgi:hypothetical protein
MAKNKIEQPTRKVGEDHATGKSATTHIEKGNSQGSYGGKLSLGKAASMEGPKSDMPAEAKRYENKGEKLPGIDDKPIKTVETWDQKRDRGLKGGG